MGGFVYEPMPNVAAPGVDQGSPEWKARMAEWNGKRDEEKERLRIMTLGFPTPQVHEKLPVREIMRRFDGVVVIGIAHDRPRMTPNP